MAQTVFGAEYAVSVLNRAFNNTSPSNAVFNNQVKTAGDTEASQHAFAAQFAKSFVNTSDAALAKQVLVNMGVQDASLTEVQPLEAALAEYFGTVSKEDRGIVVLQLGTILSGLETATGDQAEYVPAAKAWNVEIERAYVYSSNPAHTTPQEGDDGAGSTTLTRFTDVLSGSAFTGYLDYNQFTGVDEQTLTTGDRLTGSAGEADTLFAQQTVGSRPTLSGIEIVSIDAKGVAPTLDLSDSTGIKQVVNYRSSETSTLTFQGLKNLVDVEVDHTNANTVVAFNGSVVAGVNDTLNLSVKGAGVAAKPSNFTAQGIENLNIAATEDNSVLGTIASGNVKKVVITGDKNLTVGTKAVAANPVADAQAVLAAAVAAQGVTAGVNTAAQAVKAQLATIATNIANVLNAAEAAGVPNGGDGTLDANEFAVADLGVIQLLQGTGLPSTNAVFQAAIAPGTPFATARAAADTGGASVASYIQNIQDALINYVTTVEANSAAQLVNDNAAVAAAQAALANAIANPVVAPQGFTSANIETVDGSEATGNLFLDLRLSAGRDQTVTTGSGNDTVVTGNLSATDTFNLGEGNDRLVLTTTSTNEAAKLQGVEEVEARVANTLLNLTNAADVKLLAVAENAGFANVTAAKSGTTVGFEGRGLANTVSSSAVAFGGVTYNLAGAGGTSDVIDVTFKNAGMALGANSKVNIGALTNTGNNVETLNFTFNDVVATSTVTVADINGSALKTLNVTSDSKVVFTDGLGNIGVDDLVKLTSVDATGVKAGFEATFGLLAKAAASTIKLGGAGANKVTVTSDENAVDAATTATLLTVDASAGTGAQTIKVTNSDESVADVLATNTAAKVAAAGSKVGANVIGGAGADEITVVTAVKAISTIRGGAGSDKIVLGDNSAAANQGTDVIVLALGDSGSTVATGQTITDFNANNAANGLDYLDLRSLGIDSTLQTVAQKAGALTGSVGDFTHLGVTSAVATYNQGGNLVVAIDANGDNTLNAGDLVITLMGVAQGDFTTLDIIWGS